MINFLMVDYKGKHFIIQDKIDDVGMEFEIGKITKELATSPEFIAQHKALCQHYGIPCYHGKDEDLIKIYN